MELWFVLFEQKFYVITGDPKRTQWVQNLLINPRVRIRVKDVESQATARVLDPSEQPLWDTVSQIACEKYREPEPWGTPIELTPLATANATE